VDHWTRWQTGWRATFYKLIRTLWNVRVAKNGHFSAVLVRFVPLVGYVWVIVSCSGTRVWKPSGRGFFLAWIASGHDLTGGGCNPPPSGVEPCGDTGRRITVNWLAGTSIADGHDLGIRTLLFIKPEVHHDSPATKHEPAKAIQSRGQIVIVIGPRLREFHSQ